MGLYLVKLVRLCLHYVRLQHGLLPGLLPDEHVSVRQALPTKESTKLHGLFFARWGLFFARWGLFFANINLLSYITALITQISDYYYYY